MNGHRSAVALIVALVVAFVALIGSVWLVGAKSSDDLRRAEASARQQQTTQLRAGCGRAVHRDFESLEANTELAVLAQQAGLKFIADDAAGRAKAIRARVPSSADDASIAQFCASLYPPPQ